jgi:hypothetical protein
LASLKLIKIILKFQKWHQKLFIKLLKCNITYLAKKFQLFAHPLAPPGVVEVFVAAAPVVEVVVEVVAVVAGARFWPPW